MLRKSAVCICFYSILTIPSFSFAVKDEQKTSPPSSARGVKTSPKRGVTLPTSPSFEDYSIRSLTLEETLSSAITLLQHSLEHIEFFQARLVSIKPHFPIDRQCIQYQLYFGRIAPTHRKESKSLEVQREMISKQHSSLKQVIGEYLDLLHVCLKDVNLISSAENAVRVGKLLEQAKSQIEGTDGFRAQQREAEKMAKKSPRTLSPRSLSPRKWVPKMARRHSLGGEEKMVMREDHLVGLLQDQIALWKIISDSLAPYSISMPVESGDSDFLSDLSEQEEPPEPKGHQQKAILKKESQQRLFQVTKLDLSKVVGTTDDTKESEEDSTLFPIDESCETVEGSEKESSGLEQEEDIEDLGHPLVQRYSLGIGAKKEKSFDVRGTSPRDMNTSPRPIPTWSHRKLKNWRSRGLSVEKRCFGILERIFQKPSLIEFPLDKFDFMITSTNGFCGSVFPGKRSQIYEIYVLEDDDKVPLHFINLETFLRKQDMGGFVTKYSFMLPRPHPTETFRKGDRLYMYPKLIALAREHLKSFHFSPETLKGS